MLWKRCLHDHVSQRLYWWFVFTVSCITSLHKPPYYENDSFFFLLKAYHLKISILMNTTYLGRDWNKLCWAIFLVNKNDVIMSKNSVKAIWNKRVELVFEWELECTNYFHLVLKDEKNVSYDITAIQLISSIHILECAVLICSNKACFDIWYSLISIGNHIWTCCRRSRYQRSQRKTKYQKKNGVVQNKTP